MVGEIRIIIMIKKKKNIYAIFRAQSEATLFTS